MSRSGYSEDCEDQWGLIRWRGAVNSAIKGRRGQALLHELLAVLDAMPDKRLYRGNFATPAGEYCTLGALGKVRGVQMDDLGDEEDGSDPKLVGKRFGIAHAMAAEIMFENDECIIHEWVYKDIEICGPMRPKQPDWGRHKRTAYKPNPHVPAQRWLSMRNWVASQITPQPPADAPASPA